jgi:protocatechuate 3,4-dioxygenase, alpha subunit
MSRGNFGQTPSQTVGPYFSMRLAGEGENVVITERTVGERIRIEGRVLDGDGRQVEDALLEIWQADAEGHYLHPSDRWSPQSGDGSFRFDTIKPGAVPGGDGEMQAPHIAVIVQARGMLNALYTRVYFVDEAQANALDMVLLSVPEARRSALVAERVGSDDGTQTYHFDIRLQGDNETPFFDV